MRLICPNCDAQYEVDDSAIGADGRDVQCSNCGHGWFQLPPDIAAELEAETVPPRKASGTKMAPPAATKAASAPKSKANDKGAIWEDDAEGALTETAAAVSSGVNLRSGPEAKPLSPPQPLPQPTAPSVAPKPAPSADQAPHSAPPRRTMDESLLAVLREEAERETSVRRSETPRPLESQPDLGLEETTGAASAAKAVRDRLARLRGPEAKPDTADKPTARRDLLPDIEEINSTLRASTENRSSEAFSTFQSDAVVKAEPDAGFRSGFTLMLGIAVLLVVTYLAASEIGEQFPATKAALDSYVLAVDAARVWLDAAMRNAISALQNLTTGPES